MTYAAHGGWLFFALVKCGLETQPKTGATWLKSVRFRSLTVESLLRYGELILKRPWQCQISR